ncbi:hypothetical protein Catovirus_1_59 [Catovirus CTV1]|uniref:Uncharacterized protein n=1 Tax=Catovirus CTV1 TaxID=1977631 RepID=A0A1V0S8I0_9VIRU|nr:hypothetical protein Catovirus_1_59 [Catovirus CTV1]
MAKCKSTAFTNIKIKFGEMDKSNKVTKHQNIYLYKYINNGKIRVDTIEKHHDNIVDSKYINNDTM